MDGSNLYVATEVFADVLDGAQVISVDPNACIPFIRVRTVVKSGVHRIKHSYSSADREDNTIATGAVCGGSLPTVVQLTGPFGHHVVTYFMEEFKLGRDDAEAKAKSRKVWYGIVDGQHRLVALLELQQEMPNRWAGFRWSVLLLQGHQAVEVLRAFARAQNMRQTNEQFVQTTLYDLLSGLRDEAMRLAVESGGRRPTAKDVADRYSSSSERTSNAMRTLAGIALKLSPEVLQVIGDVMNFECPRLACSYYAMKERVNYTEADIENKADCRVYRNFLTMTSLRQSSAFLNATGNNVEELQINTILRLRDCCRNSGFKPVLSGMVLEQFTRATAAYKESEKFQTLICSEVWPRGMEKLKENLLRTTVLDDDVEANAGNGKDILPAVIHQFRRCVPQKASLLEARYYSSLGTDNDEQLNGENEEAMAQRSTFVLQSDGNDVESERPELTQRDEQHPPDNAVEGHELLQKHGMTCFEMDWQQYNRSLHSSTDALYDLILTEPPRGVGANKSKARKGVDETIDEREMKDFAQFALRVLVPGGYLLLFTAAKYFKDWVMALRCHEFNCVDYPFVVAKNSKGLQRENRVLFPQNVCDLIVMAVSPGKKLSGFEADLQEAYKLVHCAYKRKFAAIDGVPVVTRRLRYDQCRSVVCTSEKNPVLLAELMVTFSPPGGTVLDPYAGTMSLGAACLNVARRCVLIEKDPECFKLAFNRLVRLTRAQDMSNKAHFVPATPTSSDDCRPKNVEDLLNSPDHHSAEDSDENDRHSTEVDPARGADGDEFWEDCIGTGACPSIPSTPSSPPEKPTQVSETQEDTKVALLKNGAIVARALIKDDTTDATCFQSTLHGTALSEFEKEDERLVVVWQVEVMEEYKNEPYPYSYGGPDGPVGKLKEMEGGFHAWDLNAMRF